MLNLWNQMPGALGLPLRIFGMYISLISRLLVTFWLPLGAIIHDGRTLPCQEEMAFNARDPYT